MADLKQAATAGPAVGASFCDTVLRCAGRLALVLLGTIYFRAAVVSGNLWSDPDWTISNVMVYPCNEQLTNLLLFPAYLTMCIVYSLKLSSPRIRLGSIAATIGGIGLIAYPTTTNRHEHLAFVLLTFVSSLFWYPECTATQFKTFGFSSVLFLGGAAVGHVRQRGQAFPFLPSFTCMMGEFGIFITWGWMLLNPPPRNRNGRARE
jgi:hypothetical protein